MVNKIRFLEADNALLKRRVYNFTGFSTSPQEIESIVAKSFPDFKIGYKIDFRQHIADNWPATIDADRAHRHWGMKIDYHLERTLHTMLEDVKAMFKQTS